eukprot:UN27195
MTTFQKALFKYLTLLLMIVQIAYCNRDNEILATFKDGKIIRKELRDLIHMMQFTNSAQSAKWKKNTVRQLTLLNILNEKSKIG